MGTMLAELPLGQPIPCSVSADEEGLDLHGALVPHPTCSFYMRVSGQGLRSHGIHDGDLLVIDRSVEPRSGDVVIVAHGGSIRAALAHAMGITAHQALLFSIKNLGLTRLEKTGPDWRVAAVNEEPWTLPG
jgi:hypothetical protein